MTTNDQPDRPRRFLRLSQVAEMLDISPAVAYSMAANGELPAFKVRRSWRFPAEEIERFIADGLARTA